MNSLKDFLPLRCFLSQFDKDGIECSLPIGFVLKWCSTNLVEFDLQDKKESILQEKGTGTATYINKTEDEIVVIDYENLIHSLPQRINAGKRAPKCCDFIVYSNDGSSFFICNELSSSETKTKWPDARNQFADTIRRILKCSETKKVLDLYKQKLCILSTKIKNIISPDDIAAPFTIPFTLMKNPEKLSCSILENMHFEIWEANLIVYEDEHVSIFVR